MKKLSILLVCLFAMLATGTGLKAQEVTVTLIPGWTWISYPTTEAVDFVTALGDFTPMAGDVIKSQWGSAIYRNGQWKGTISQFNPGYGYHYYSNRTEPVAVTFNALQPASQVIVTTTEPTDITTNSATCGGNVASSDGNFVFVILRGICWSTNPNPTFNDNYVEVGNGIGSFTASMTDLSIGTTYYVRAFAVTANGTFFGEELNFTTLGGGGSVGSHDYVDLGLPSGLLWATCNVGADNPEEYGDYFPWYDDVATANWGGPWYMPTYGEWQELLSNTTHTWTTQNGVNGRLFTASNGNSIFLPATFGSSGSYWSSSPATDDPDDWVLYGYFCYLDFNSDHCNMEIWGEPEIELSVRPVRSGQNLSFNINATGSPAEGGEVSGGGTYPDRAECTLTATPSEGWRFMNWTENGEEITISATYSFIVKRERTLVANFIYIGGEDHAYVDLGLPSSTLWATCNVGAENPEDYGGYIHWYLAENTAYWWGSGWRMPTEAELQELLDNTTHTWTTRNGVNGRLFTASNGNSIFLPAAGTIWGDVGSCGYYWSGSVEEDIWGVYDDFYPYNLYFNSDDCHIASYYVDCGLSVRPVRSGFRINATPNLAEGGSVSGGGAYLEGAECTLTAMPSEGWRFVNWMENGEVVSTETTYTFTVTGGRTLVANFTDNYAYVDLGLPSGQLWATCNVGADNPEDYGDYFAWGETEPKNKYNWSTYQYCMGSNTTMTKYCNNSSYGYNGFTDDLTTLLPEDDAVKANWGNEWRMPTKEEWQELYNNTTNVWTTRNGVDGRLFTAANGNSLFLPAAGYRNNSSLSENGVAGDYLSSSLYTSIPSRAWEFNFGENNYGMSSYGHRQVGLSVRAVRNLPMVTVSVNPPEGGTVSGGGTYAEGATCTLTATPSEFWSFVNWMEDGVVVSTDATFIFGVMGDRTLVANFQIQSFNITASAFPTMGGTVSGGGTYDYGQDCTLTATANENYTFVNWTEEGVVVSTDAAYTFTVTGGRFLVANFSYSVDACIDLGLPSGLLWATCNVSADAPWDYGDYFAWGETQPKDTYNGTTYQYCEPHSNLLTKYCNNPIYGFFGFTDNLTTLLPEDDAATANWGADWRMPTKEEFQELYNNTTVTWTTQNGVNGQLFTASNGNNLFLPAAGYRYNSNLYNAGSDGNYWSSSLSTDRPDNAWRLYFNLDGYDVNYGSLRYCGQSVRPVRSSGQN